MRLTLSSRLFRHLRTLVALPGHAFTFLTFRAQQIMLSGTLTKLVRYTLPPCVYRPATKLSPSRSVHTLTRILSNTVIIIPTCVVAYRTSLQQACAHQHLLVLFFCLLLCNALVVPCMGWLQPVC